MKRMMRTAFAVLTAMAMAGCAGNAPGNGGGDGGDGEFLRVTVENDGIIPTQLRIYLIAPSGQETTVGAMSTLGTETLTVRLADIQGSYQLRAEGGTGYVITSPRVSLRGNETVRWELRRNIVRLGNR
ncbi:MAG TPA: hypothetical protein VHG93_15690 [Longimicrobium sp.]|nr:hypothetical protein [Longimicrobium sp.]